jgi:hypothetical protein
MTNDLAPIGVSTYARLQHLQQTVAALQKNTLAQQSELFVFSDAPRPGDEERVAAVRSYLRTVDGFKVVHIVEREKNSRTENNRGGLRMLLDRFGKVIFLEEDVVAAPGFLSFMNTALKRYQNDQRVFSVNGWCPQFSETPPLTKGSTFFVPRFSGWGLGIWKDRFDKIKKISVEDVEALEKDPVALNRIYKQMGSDVMSMIQTEALGKTNALDVRCCYYQAITGGLTLYPYPTLARNIGLDGTGVHCGNQLTEINGEFSEEFINEYLFPEDILVNKKVGKIFSEQFVNKILFRQRVIRFLKKIGIYQHLRPIVKKFQHQLKGNHP